MFACFVWSLKFYFEAPSAVPILSLFSGVGGLELGLSGQRPQNRARIRFTN